MDNKIDINEIKSNDEINILKTNKEKKEFKLFKFLCIWILSLLLILLLEYFVINYLHNKEMKKKNEIKQPEIIKTENQLYYENKGYEDILNSIEPLNKRVKIKNFNSMPDIYFFNKYDGKEIHVKLIVEDNIAYFTFNDEKLELPIKNVKKVFMHNFNGCSVSSYEIYILTNDGNIYKFYDKNNIIIHDLNAYNINKYIKRELNKINNNFKKINKNVYKNIKYVEYPNLKSCGIDADIIGITNNNKYYKLKDESELKINEYPYYDELLTFGDLEESWYLINLDYQLIKFNDKKNTNITYKYKLNNYIITNENILYKYDKDFIKIGKIVNLYKLDNNYGLILENDEKLDIIKTII